MSAAGAPAPWRADAVRTPLDSRWGTVRLLSEVDSTLDEIARIARKDGLPAGSWVLVASHEQRAGRGRRGRAWHARPGDALLFSIATRLYVPAARWPSASLVVGHAVWTVLRALLPSHLPADTLGLRWPNDLLAGPEQRKLAGVLCERITTAAAPAGHGSGRASRPAEDAVWVAGVGLNLRAPQLAALRPHTAGLADLVEGGLQAIDRDALLGELAATIAQHIDAWQLRGGRLLPELHGRSLRFCGVEVGLDLGDGRRCPAWLDGLAASGALRVRDVVGGRPRGAPREVTPLRILDARTDPPWHHPPDVPLR